MKLFSLPVCKNILVVLFVSLATVSFSQKKYPSLLWEISGNGLTKPSYMYGTMHVSKKVAFHLTEAFFEALDKSDVIALETNPELWLSELMEESSDARMNNAFKKYMNFTQDFYKDAFGFFVPTDKSIRFEIAKEPENVNGLLYRFSGYSGNFEEQTYLDLFIMQAARKSGKDIASLEDYKTSLEMVTKASIPDDTEEKRGNKKFYNSYMIFEQIENAYRSGDLDALDSLNKISSPSKKYDKYMLIDRNKIMAEHMDSLMKKRVVFTAIGAAHLPGDEGVITLLQKMGYTVKPVKSEITKKSIHQMSDLAEQHTSLNFKAMTVVDSLVKVEAPGKMYEMNGDNHYCQYLYTDMVNGSYYVIKRIPTYGTLSGLDGQKQYDRVDKMLYESVPGKIVKKKKITSNTGDPGFDIVNKTTRGDYQRYQIFTTGDYIYIFKVGGTGDYANTSVVEPFFKSIRFNPKPNATVWSAFSPSYGGYEISVPGNFVYEKPTSTVQFDRVTATAGKEFYVFNRSLLNDYTYIEEDTFDLRQLAREFADPLEYKISSVTFGKYLNYPSIDATAKHEKDGSFLHMRIVIKDAQYYLLACRSESDKAPENYFSSLKFKKFNYPAMEVYKDTSLYFSVKTDYKEIKMSSIEKLISEVSYFGYGYGKKGKKKASYLSDSKDKTIESNATGESVKIEYYKANDYRMDKSMDALWEKQVNYYKENTTLAVKVGKKFEKEKVQVMDLMLTDTNSIRAIKVRMFYKPGLLYQIYTMIDTVGGPSEWVNTFYDSFMPADTALSVSTFTDKLDDILKDAASTDSVTRDKVNSLYQAVSLQDKHADKLMKFIASKDFNNASSDVRVGMISDLGHLKNAAIVPFLKKEYDKYADSSSLQLAILRAVSSQQTKEGNAAFIAMLQKEPPLSDNSYSTDNIFRPFYDSLEIAGSLYPALFELTRYPEYKDCVYGLLSSLLDSAKVTSAFYAEQKKDILRQTNEELKRQIASEETSSNNSYGGSEDYGAEDIERMMAEEAARAAAEAAGGYDDYGYDSYNGGNAGVNWNLVNYYDLLAPFYNTDPAVKASFDKAFKSKSNEFRIELMSILLNNKITVPDTMINNFAKNAKTRAYLYSNFERNKRLSLIPAPYRTQDSLVYAFLYGDEEKDRTDSIQFIEKRYVTSPSYKGYVYFYTSVTKKSGQKYLNYCGFQPKEQDKVNSDPRISSRYTPFDPEKKLDEQINEICDQLSMTGRKRVRSDNDYLSSLTSLYGGGEY